MKKPIVFAALLGSFAAALAFQNCTVPATSSSSSTAADSLAFSYDAKINQIAYMSCSTMNSAAYDTSAYFSYRVGAYDNTPVTPENAGLILTSDYLNLVSQRPAEGKWGFISQSPANSATVMQIAVRRLGDLQHVETESGSPVENKDYQNMLEELGTTGVSKALVELPAGKRLKYLTNGSVYGARMEASLYFLTSETLAANVRNDLNGDTFALGLTYTDAQKSGIVTAARSPASIAANGAVTAPTPSSTPASSRDVFGRGYHLRFSKPTEAASVSNYPQNILGSVTEQDFHTLTDRQGSWECSKLRFKIMRNLQDAGTFGCSINPDPATPPALLKIARNSLRYEDWYIDMNKMCITPKKNGTSCYGPNQVVQYDLTKDCLPNPATNNATVDANMACLAYASVCYRTN